MFYPSSSGVPDTREWVKSVSMLGCGRVVIITEIISAEVSVTVFLGL